MPDTWKEFEIESKYTTSLDHGSAVKKESGRSDSWKAATREGSLFLFDDLGGCMCNY